MNEEMRVFTHKGWAMSLQALEEDVSERKHWESCGWTAAEIKSYLAKKNMFFCAKVAAYGENGLPVANTYLGACSYKSLDVFMQDEYFFQMCDEVLEEMLNSVKRGQND